MSVEIEDLHVSYATDRGPVNALRGVDLVIGSGERVGLVGESGCGKSTLVAALLGLLPADATVSGRITIGDLVLDAGERSGWSGVRGREIAVVPQGAMAGLHPCYRVDAQVAEIVRIHTSRSRDRAGRRALELLDGVGLGGGAATSFPHQLSGGMRQRVALAAALACRPRLLVADEPTVGLDTATADDFLTLLTRRQRDDGFALLMVSHDLGTVRSACARLVVAYDGRIVESGPLAGVEEAPMHPYSAGLLAASPCIGSRGWAAIPGSPPDPSTRRRGCWFAPRCPHRYEACDDEPVLAALVDEASRPRLVACHRYPTESLSPVVALTTVFPTLTKATRTPPFPVRSPHSDVLASPVVTIRSLTKTYRSRRWLRTDAVDAVQDVDLDIWPGEILGLVGVSGSGKSTLARLLFGLVEADAGSIVVDGTEIVGSRRQTLRHARRRMALVHQDPYASLHPGLTVADLVAEPLAIARTPRPQRRELVARAVDAVGLDPGPSTLDRRPHQLSGGQRQRVALARAFVAEPSVVVLDEPMSMLDASVRAGIAETLLDARRRIHLTMVVITHDLAEATNICGRIAVIDAGHIVEIGAPSELIDRPRHPATRRLFDLAQPAPLTPVRTDRTAPVEWRG